MGLKIVELEYQGHIAHGLFQAGSLGEHLDKGLWLWSSVNSSRE